MQYTRNYHASVTLFLQGHVNIKLAVRNKRRRTFGEDDVQHNVVAFTGDWNDLRLNNVRWIILTTQHLKHDSTRTYSFCILSYDNVCLIDDWIVITSDCNNETYVHMYVRTIQYKP